MADAACGFVPTFRQVSLQSRSFPGSEGASLKLRDPIIRSSRSASAGAALFWSLSKKTNTSQP